MSRTSLSTDEKDNKSYHRAWSQIYQLIRMGGTWSGNERNCAFLNMGNGKFSNVSVGSGIDFLDEGRGLVTVDWDHDGDLDVWTSNRSAPRLRLLRNEAPRSGHSLHLKLIGNGTTTSRDAIGARVEVVTHPASSSPQINTLRAGEGFISQNTKWLHFGLGKATKVSEVVVKWPGGEIERFAKLTADKRYTLQQGSGQAQESSSEARKSALTPKKQELLPRSDALTLRLITPVETPPLPYQTLDGKRQVLRATTGQPMFVNLWASWCQPCVKELREIASAESDIRAAGLDIVALSVDGQGDQDSSPADAAAFLKTISFPFRSGTASKALLDGMQTLHDIHTPMLRPLPLPSSFLVDARGRLVAIYEGPVAIHDVLDDLKNLGKTESDRIQKAASFPGSVMEHDVVSLAQRRRESELRFRVAKFLQSKGLWRDALIQYEALLGLKVALDRVHAELGTALIRQKKFDQAETHLKKALEYDPLSVASHINLGGLFFQKKNLAQAAVHFAKADELEPGNAQNAYNLGMAYIGLGKYAEAADSFGRALKTDPKMGQAYFRRAAALERLGKLEEATSDLTSALKSQANFLPAVTKRAAIYRRLNKHELALADYNRAIELQPDNGKHYNDRGYVQASLGKYAEALKDYETSLEWEPGNPETHNNLGWLLATCPDEKIRNGELAIEEAEIACQLVDWSESSAIDTLAAAYASAGNFKEAIRWQEKALQLAPEPAKAGMRQRIKQYRAGKPYIDSSKS